MKNPQGYYLPEGGIARNQLHDVHVKPWTANEKSVTDSSLFREETDIIGCFVALLVNTVYGLDSSVLHTPRALCQNVFGCSLDVRHQSTIIMRIFTMTRAHSFIELKGTSKFKYLGEFVEAFRRSLPTNDQQSARGQFPITSRSENSTSVRSNLIRELRTAVSTSSLIPGTSSETVSGRCSTERREP
jgi:hypothetical protein